MKVVLLDNNRESKCFGLVHVSVNGVNKPVCAKKWTQQNSETVCKELNCGKVRSLKTSSHNTSQKYIYTSLTVSTVHSKSVRDTIVTK